MKVVIAGSVAGGAVAVHICRPEAAACGMEMQETKGYCGRYCGRGQLLAMLGGRFGLSRRRDIPGRMKSRTFRYGFWLLFFAMFFLALWNTCLMFAGLQDLRQVVTLLRTFKLPWQWACHDTLFLVYAKNCS